MNLTTRQGVLIFTFAISLIFGITIPLSVNGTALITDRGFCKELSSSEILTRTEPKAAKENGLNMVELRSHHKLSDKMQKLTADYIIYSLNYEGIAQESKYADYGKFPLHYRSKTLTGIRHRCRI